MKTLNIGTVGIASLLASGIAVAQGGGMMNGSTGDHGSGMGWGGGGIWLAVLVCVVVVAGVIWAFQNRR